MEGKKQIRKRQLESLTAKMCLRFWEYKPKIAFQNKVS